MRVDGLRPGPIRPHERTHPGPKEDRLRLTRATSANLSPIFALHAGDAYGRAAPPRRRAVGRGHRRRRHPQPPVARRRPGAHRRAPRRSLADAELLIADGHHRYETARVYAEEIGGEGEHRYVLMCLVSLEDPGLTVFPTHRLARRAQGHRPAQERLGDRPARSCFDIEQIERGRAAPARRRRPAVQSATSTATSSTPYRLTLKDQAIADARAAGHARALPPARHRGARGAHPQRARSASREDDISHLRRAGLLAHGRRGRSSSSASGAYDAAFFLRATPVTQVQEIAAAGVNMPPKSTFFYPKVPTGLLFNPLG